MQGQVKATPYDQFYFDLSQSQTVGSPSEIHGILCGFVCVGRRLNGGFWIDSLLKRLAATRPKSRLAPQGAVVSLYDAICRQLGGFQSFELLLPGIEHRLEDRAEALGLWCEGFLAGLGLGEDKLGGDSMVGRVVSDAVHETLYCIAEIAGLKTDKIEISEIDKFAFGEAIEFVTNAVPIIYKELTKMPVNSSMASLYLH